MKEELLYVDPEALVEDFLSGREFRRLTEDQRCLYEVVIDGKGQFRHKATNELVDTATMIAHGKQGYAGYVLTDDHRLFLFNHRDARDKIGHTSMTCGGPVIAAGEVIIDEGELNRVNSYSGHYRPSLFSMKRVLAYFQGKKVEMDQVEVETFGDPKSFLKHLPSRRVVKTNHDEYFHTPATAILNSYVDRKTQRLIKAFDAQEKSLLTRLYRMIENAFSITPGLTDRRNALRQAFRREASLPIPPGQTEQEALEIKIRLASDFIQTNNALSSEYGKKENVGRFYKEMVSYKTTLEKQLLRALNPSSSALAPTSHDSKMRRIF